MKRGKKWTKVAEQVQPGKIYEPSEAAELVKKVSYTKFDGTIDASIKIGYKSYQNVRGIVKLPHGSGRKIRVAVIAKEDKHAEAQAAGADVIGAADLIEKIQKENYTDFDAVVATPDMMKDIGKIAPILGRKGLMPKPKAGTVTADVAGAVKALKAGQTEYRPDKTGVIHLGIGKISFDAPKLEDNIRAVFQAIIRDRPSDAKGEYVKSFYISPTMGPGIRVNIRSLAV
ncbi:MAG: 50S ribosomal protein L1 [Spirochaetia bacterium]|nr:50S ribosomal protein L1 [Spirochaetia bacterium]